jgi:uncharacterized protein
MAEWTKSVSGAFCWTEVATSDPASSKKFYANLFGWTIEDVPMPGGGEPYGMAKVGGKMVGGISTLSEEARKMGASPMWLSYVAVENAEASARKVAELGGKVVLGPMNVGQGTMAIFVDPTGATCALWQQHESMGTFLYQQVGALSWNELMTTNVDQAGKFYAGLFGWKLETVPMPSMQYTLLKNGDKNAGGMMPMPKDAGKMPSAWAVYFEVADADATFAKAQSMGAKPIMPLMDVPNVGRFGMLLDPQGAAFAVIKSSYEAK